MKEYSQGSMAGLQGYICIPAMDEDLPSDLLFQLEEQMRDHALLVHINAQEGADELILARNIKIFEEIINWVKGTNLSVYICMENAWPKKIAGVGNARKYIMDMAAEWGSPQSWIAGLDADCKVAHNYISGLDNYFSTGLKAGASIRFEHVVPKDQELALAIKYYETHLRYLKLGLQYAGFPFYYHTVGSSMAVSAWAYLKSGGMNSRKAGEDFYFLQKIMPLGFGEINDTVVFPAARLSYRVPFGTGKAISAHMAGNKVQFYPMAAITELRRIMNGIISSMNSMLGTDLKWEKDVLPLSIKYLENKGLSAKWNKISANVKTVEARNRNFLQLLSGNMMLLLLNELRTDMPIVVDYEFEVKALLSAMSQPCTDDLLLSLRKAEAHLK